MRFIQNRKSVSTRFIFVFFAMAIAASCALAAKPATALTFNVTSYGAYGDNIHDDQNAIVAALGAANLAGGGTVFFPAGTYLHSDLISVPTAITLSGTQFQSFIKATNAYRSTLWFHNVAHCGVQNLGILGVTGIPRQTNGETTGIWFNSVQHCVIQNITISGGASAGILVDSSSTDVQITGNNVSNTMADGTHVTGGSNFVTVSGNTAYNTGDDSFAAVAYANDPQTHDITFTNNVSTQSKARGVTCIGANNCIIQNNTVVNPSAHGIAVAYEQYYNTWHPANATVTGNSVTGAAGYTFNAFLIDGATQVTLTNNTVVGSQSVFIHSSTNVNVVALQANNMLGPAILAQLSTAVVISGSTVTGATGTAITYDRVTGGTIGGINNMSGVCSLSGATAIYVTGSANLLVTGNTVLNTLKTVYGVVSVVNSTGVTVDNTNKLI